MMRVHVVAIGVAATALAWIDSDAVDAGPCSYVARYPPAVGQHAFMLATAMAGTVMAPLDTPHTYRPRSVPAQVMAVDDVAGHRSEEIRRGLRASGGTAAFVRYHIGAGCGPIPASDGAFDSAGTSGLYVGSPRPADRWIDGRPTFDVFRAAHYPLPQRLNGPSGHLVITLQDTTPTMTAAELFTMYRALWAESVTVDDTSVTPRIRRWLAGNPRTARKQPAEQVALDMLSAASDARIAASPVPFGGTFAITVVVPGVDSLVLYGRTTTRARPWATDVIRDGVTGVPVAAVRRTFAIDVTTATSRTGFDSVPMQVSPCVYIPLVVNALPIVPDADSTWRGELWPALFLECAPPGSALAALNRPGAGQVFAAGPVPVTFRRHPGGRVTFEAQASRGGSHALLVRGERIAPAPGARS